ncbi:MAG: DUF2683 family protein [Candidatus ainarchaeum sp.]|nr:DUF2683 family protein [Candidatus ainarchaeum sp.]MDD3975551.1 DUF2683 family protein [Candidatus ainarchaeum sp.]
MKILVNLSEDINQTLNIIKAKNNLKNISETISFLVRYYDENELKPELKPDFIKKIKEGDKIYKPGSGVKFKTVEDLDKYILK